MATDLTIKQKKYVKERLKGSTGVKAVADIYNTTSYGSASALSTKLNKTPKIRKEIEEGLNKLDITPEYLLRELKNLISKGNKLSKMINNLRKTKKAKSLDTSIGFGVIK